MGKVGIIGAGQLGQMLGYAARDLGLQCTFLDPGDTPPAATAGEVIKDTFDGERGLRTLVQQSDVISYEFENVPVETIESLTARIPVYPPPDALRFSQDRLQEKQLFEQLEIPVPGYRRIDSHSDLNAAIDELGLPLVLKTRRMGYDGKGQAIIRNRSEGESALASLGSNDLIAEQWVAYDRELSAIGVRSVSGELAFYPLTENRHEGGILRVSRAPADDDKLTPMAVDYLTRLLARFDYVGVLTLELFVYGERLLANEIAPRVHNSGHWTIEGAETSQFENHLRAILDWPLGPTRALACAGMLNIIGEMPELGEPGSYERTFLHNYGKTARPGRKLGHVTVLGDDEKSREKALKQLAPAFPATANCNSR